MLTQDDEDSLSLLFEKKWREKYFHNDRDLILNDMNRDVERANQHYRANGSAAIFKRVKAHLRRTGRIELGAVRSTVRTNGKEDTKEWLKQFGSIRIFHDISKQYDFAVKEVELSFDQVYHGVKITFQTKNTDEGFFGGRTTLRYETERIREERKIEAKKKENERLID